MNRTEFLKKIYIMYPNTFTTGEGGNGKAWREAYESVLSENMDYDLLFYKFTRSYPHTHIAPAPSYFMYFKKDVIIKKQIKQEIKEEYCPPTKEFLEAKKNLQKELNKKVIVD